jgi:predicted nucleic acid-binding Zn ribbon protein
MFCPSCGKEIPYDSRCCLVCGKSPTAIIDKELKPKQRSQTRTVSLGLIGLLGLYVIGALMSKASNNVGASRQDPLTPSTFRVGAGQMYYVQFSVDGPARVAGRFQASGGGGNDIQAVVMDVDSFENWKNGHQARAFYQSEKTTVGNINVPINQPGTYYLAFNDRFSLISDKTVTANVLLYH